MKKIVNGIEVNLSEEEIADRQRLKDEHSKRVEKRKAEKYKRDRAKAYPSVEEQLDLIYHKGMDAWKAEIATIKAKYPKPGGS